MIKVRKKEGRGDKEAVSEAVHDNVVHHEAAGDELEQGAADKARKCAKGGNYALACLFAGEGGLADEGSYHRAYDYPDGGEEQAHQNPCQSASGSVFAASRCLGEVGRNQVVQNRNHSHDGHPDQKQAGGHGVARRVCALAPEVKDHHSQPGDRRAGNDRKHASDDAEQSEEYCKSYDDV